MNKKTFYLASLIATTVVTVTACNSNDSSQSNAASTPAATAQGAQLSDVKNIVVIYAENHSFDDIYGNFPGANGLQNATASSTVQLDRDGTPLPTLPQIWGGLTAPGVSRVITQAMTAGLPNAPFAIDDPNGFNASSGETTLDMDHRFYENQ